MGKGMALLMLPLESTTARSAFVSEELLSAGGNPENSNRVGWAGGRVLDTCAGMFTRTRQLLGTCEYELDFFFSFKL